MIKRELKILLTAIMFYTRIPVPKFVGYSADTLTKATRYFPAMGIIVGGVGAGVFIGLSSVLGNEIAVIFTLISMLVMTGAFHEDGLADFCDGFGGGYTSEKILSIMKDSRIGTYGTAGLCLLLLSKYVLLTELSIGNLPMVLIAAQVFSRYVAVILIFSSQYVSNTNRSKSKPVGEKKSAATLIVASLFGLISFVIFDVATVLVIVLTQALLLLYFRYYIHKKISGYTGDVLGALQQISEVTFYLSFILITSIQ